MAVRISDSAIRLALSPFPFPISPFPFCVVLLAAVLAGAAPQFQPARLLRGEAPPPSPLAAAGWTAEVLVVQVDPDGRVGGAQSPGGPPHSRSFVDSWTFAPARDDGMAVPARVLVATMFRPPTFLDVAGPPDLSRFAAQLPADVPRPVQTEAPPYPAGRLGSAAVIVELRIGPTGAIEGSSIVGPASGFDGAALSAAASWRFEPARRGGTPVPAFAYLVFGFREPVGG